MNRRTFLAASATAALAPQLTASAGDGDLPFRQVHLDFHTSEHVPDVGSEWDTTDFIRTLRTARVNSINIFAKCHHGWAYYNTKLGERHPSLKFDMLGEMTRALKTAGIAVNYYYSLVWDVRHARLHPEWRALDRSGEPISNPPPSNWPWLCLNSPYLFQVLAEVREIEATYKTDGAWFDILKQPPDGCFCKWCIEDRQKMRYTNSKEDIYRHNKAVAKRVETLITDIVHASNPKALTFFNSRMVIGVRDELPYYSHIEIESLPTGGWGYSHFQQRVRYMRTLGKDVIGMTGRFHKSWGDFGGLKNQAALDYECLNFLANGTKVCVGDQLHPRGKLDRTTYERIGKTYAKVEALEPWCRGSQAIADIGVISAAATNPDMTTQKLPVIDQGFTNMLLELHQQFNVLDLESKFEDYKLLILPDEILPEQGLAEKLERYLKLGGALIVSHRSLLDSDSNRFVLPAMGVKYRGPSKFRNEYMALRPGAFAGIPDESYFLYQQGSAIEAEPQSEVLATYSHPYFDRSPEKFVSHRQTPVAKRTGEPLITRRGKVIYIANPFFTSYALDAYGIQKHVTGALIGQLLPEPIVVSGNLPSTAQVTALRQDSRTIVHILHYPLTRRAPDIDIIEDAGLLADVRLKVRFSSKPSRVLLVPENRPLPFQYENGYAAFELSRVAGHQAIAIES